MVGSLINLTRHRDIVKKLTHSELVQAIKNLEEAVKGDHQPWQEVRLREARKELNNRN